MKIKEGIHFTIKSFDSCKYYDFLCRSYEEMLEHWETNHMDILEQTTVD